MDTKCYVGRDVELVFSDAPTGEELEQFEGWAETVQRMSGPHKFLFVSMSPTGNRQLEELMGYLGPLTADEFQRYRVYSNKEIHLRVRKGKGQRKANRRGRWQ